MGSLSQAKTMGGVGAILMLIGGILFWIITYVGPIVWIIGENGTWIIRIAIATPLIPQLTPINTAHDKMKIQNRFQ